MRDEGVDGIAIRLGGPGCAPSEAQERASRFARRGLPVARADRGEREKRARTAPRTSAARPGERSRGALRRGSAASRRGKP